MEHQPKRLRARFPAATTVLATVIAGTGVVASAVLAVVVAYASPALAAPESLNAVIENIRNWLVGLLVVLATLFLTIGGIRYLLAAGDPSEVGKAKDAIKYAAIGYCLAVLAPLLVQILQSFVGE